MKAFFFHVVAGLPVWAWCIVVVVGAVNEIVNRAKWTRAQSILQGIATFALWIPALGPVLERVPLLGAILRKVATPPPPTPPAPVVLADGPKTEETKPVEYGGADTRLLIALAAVSLAAYVLALAGCSPIPNLYRATSTAAVLTSVGYRALDAADKSKEAQIKQQADADLLGSAKQLRDEWRPKYAAARKALDATSAATELALAAVPTIEHAVARDKDVQGWIARLLKLAADAAAALEVAGVKLPAIGGVK